MPSRSIDAEHLQGFETARTRRSILRLSKDSPKGLVSKGSFLTESAV